MTRLRIACLFLAGAISAESPDTLKQDYAKMLEATDKLDFEAIIDATYPKLVEMAGREAMLAEMRKAFTDPTLKLSFQKTDPKIEFGAVIEHQGRRFCVVRRQTILRLAFKNKLNEQQAESIRTNIARTAPQRTVRFDANDNSFYSTGPDTTIAIADSLTKKQWRFMTYEPSLEFLLQSWFGQDILERLQLKEAPKASVVTATTVTDARYELTYKIAKIGKIWWMTENARAPITGAAHFNDDAKNDKAAGLVYKWDIAQQACPPAWRLPTVAELAEIFIKFGPISYTGENAAWKKKFGKSPEDNEQDKTFNKLMADRSLGLVAPKSKSDKDHNTMLWSSEADAVEKTAAFAILWRRKNEHIKFSGVYFSLYRDWFYGFVRCVNADIP
jgi:uncharacterized protein (TIGR02145 family)